MKINLFFLTIFLFVFSILGIPNLTHAKDESYMIKTDPTPQYLYKILSVNEWERSKTQEFVQLPKEDEYFIHLAREDQLDRIIEKYWSTVSEYVLLIIESNQLSGKLVFEANPGGTNKYYHLYNGSIPLKAVVEAKIVKKNFLNRC